jgi:hypothetical protein
LRALALAGASTRAKGSPILADVMEPSIKERLWHKMRADLAQFVPETSENDLLMCCACGRFLRQEHFDLEHLVPRQALRSDPLEVRNNPATPANVRSGNLLLCKKPLLYKNSPMYNNGCNSWKGRFYDKPISDIFSGRTNAQGVRVSNAHIVGSLMLGYLAMVAEFGFIITLMKSGLLLREQFFHPHKFRPSLGTRYQIVLVGSPFTGADEGIWNNPFSFKFERGACLVTARNYVITVPVSRDPFTPVARHLKIVPSRFKMRPDFRTAFN